MSVQIRKAPIDCSIALPCTTPTRIDLLFTMSNNPQIHVDCDKDREVMFRGRIVLADHSAARLRQVPTPGTMLRPSGPGASCANRISKRGRAMRSPKSKTWWSLSGSNRRPHACKARALPAELRPHNRKDDAKAAGIVETTGCHARLRQVASPGTMLRLSAPAWLRHA